MSKHPSALTVLGLIAMAMLGQAWADPASDPSNATAPLQSATGEQAYNGPAAEPAPATGPAAPLAVVRNDNAPAAGAEVPAAVVPPLAVNPVQAASRSTRSAPAPAPAPAKAPAPAPAPAPEPAPAPAPVPAPAAAAAPAAAQESVPMRLTPSTQLAKTDTASRALPQTQGQAQTTPQQPDPLFSALEKVLLGLCGAALLLAAVSKLVSVRSSALARSASMQPQHPAVQPPLQQPSAPMLSLSAFEGTPMPKRPQPKEPMPRYQHVASTELLDLAHRLAEEQASPGAIVQTLQDLELPIQPLTEEQAGVISVAGNSAKGWNEDSALAFHVQHYLLGECDVLMVFDGMGGLRDGKLASKLAALTMAIELNRTPDTLTSDWKVHLAAAFERVNRRFKKASQVRYGVVDSDAMRSTAIVLLANERHYVVGYQGDGQAHVRRADGSVHSLIQAHKGAASNVITHSLGPRPDGEASVSCHERLPGDLVYIASDGFDPLPANQALAFLHTHSEAYTLQQVAQGLTEVALAQRDAHGPIADDNMSLVALKTSAVSAIEPPTAQQRQQLASAAELNARPT